MPSEIGVCDLWCGKHLKRRNGASFAYHPYNRKMFKKCHTLGEFGTFSCGRGNSLASILLLLEKYGVCTNLFSILHAFFCNYAVSH